MRSSRPPANTTRRRLSHRPSPRVIREFNDRGTLWLLEDPVQLRGVLQILEPALAGKLDFARAQRVNRSFIPADLQKQESDLIFQVPFAGSDREVWVYVLLEHQSEPDRLMGLRLYLYLGHLWDSQRRQWQDANVPEEQQRLHPIIPLVFYTGTSTWSAPIGLASLMDLPAELERFVPTWETLFLNLHATPSETLTRFATAVGWALRVMQAERVPLAEMERVLAEAMVGLEGLSEEQVRQWLRVAWFLVLLVSHRRDEEGLLTLLQERAGESKFRLKKEVATMGQTIAERMGQTIAERMVEKAVEKAVDEATRQATQATMREALETVLTERFGALSSSVQRQLEEADADQMKAWHRAALRATTLEDVGILPDGVDPDTM